MTTVAWDGRELAADSRFTGGFKTDHNQKIFKVNSLHFGISGDVCSCYAFLEWAADRTKPKPRLEDIYIIEVHPDGKAYWYAESVSRVPCKAPYAIGSGAMAAMAAMLCGKSATEAVKIAAKLDENTGGKVVTAKIKQ